MTACVRCGYDLAGTPGQGVCPECALPACISREVLMGWTPRRRTLVWIGMVLGFVAVIGCLPLAALVLLPITGPLGLGRDAERVVAGSLVLSSLALSASVPSVASAAAVRRRSPAVIVALITVAGGFVLGASIVGPSPDRILFGAMLSQAVGIVALLLLWSSIHRQLVAGARGWRVAAVSIGVASAAFWAAAIAIELADPGSASDPVATVALVALMLSFAACIAMGVACLVRVRRVFRATRGTP